MLYKYVDMAQPSVFLDAGKIEVHKMQSCYNYL